MSCHRWKAQEKGGNIDLDLYIGHLCTALVFAIYQMSKINIQYLFSIKKGRKETKRKQFLFINVPIVAFFIWYIHENDDL
jgi:hypothetical protein